MTGSTKSLPEDILLIDKPAGITSFDVIRRLRKETGIRKMGHAGTLDPLATGLLIIGVESGTKKLDAFMGLPKTYHSTILLGKRTDTGDLEGNVLEESPVANIDTEEIDRTLSSMVGTLNLQVPAYSAVKQSGTPLYKKARRGERVTPPVKPMTVNSAVLQSVRQDDPYMYLDVEWIVSKGTYIRTLAEELGKRLGVPATLAQLRRTAIGPYSVENARSI